MNTVYIELRGLERLLQLVIDREFGGSLERVGNRNGQSIQEAKQRSLILKNRAIKRGGRGEGVVQNRVSDFSLLVPEQQPQGKRLLVERLVNKADSFGGVSLRKSLQQVLPQVAVGGRIERLHPGGDVVVAEVQNRKIERGCLLGDFRTKAGGA